MTNTPIRKLREKWSVVNTTLGSLLSTMVEHSTYHPKVEGLILANPLAEGERNKEELQFNKWRHDIQHNDTQCITTLSIMTFSIMTLNIKTLSIMTFSMLTLSITTFFIKLKSGWQVILWNPMCKKILSCAMDKHQLTGQNLGWVFNFRSGRLHAATFLVLSAKLPNLQLKTRPKQLLGSLPLVLALPKCQWQWQW